LPSQPPVSIHPTASVGTIFSSFFHTERLQRPTEGPVLPLPGTENQKLPHCSVPYISFADGFLCGAVSATPQAAAALPIRRTLSFAVQCPRRRQAPARLGERLQQPPDFQHRYGNRQPDGVLHAVSIEMRDLATDESAEHRPCGFRPTARRRRWCACNCGKN